MAHFAELDENNVVLQVVVINDDDVLSEDGVESEAVGIAFCKNLFGESTNWKQTSYNKNFRKNHASVGGFYDADQNAFYPSVDARPYPSWLLNYETGMYQAPVPHPSGSVDGTGAGYDWDEEKQEWVYSPDPT